MMFFCEDDIKLQGFTTNKRLLTEMALLCVILFTGGDNIKWIVSFSQQSKILEHMNNSKKDFY